MFGLCLATTLRRERERVERAQCALVRVRAERAAAERRADEADALIRALLRPLRAMPRGRTRLDQAPRAGEGVC